MWGGWVEGEGERRAISVGKGQSDGEKRAGRHKGPREEELEKSQGER